MHRISRCLAAFAIVAVGNVALAAPKSEDNVKVTIKADKPEKGKQVVTLTLAVTAPWHLYANPVGNKDLVASQTVVTFTQGGKPVEAKLEYPAGKVKKDDIVGDYKIYEGTITIKATVDVGGAGPVEAKIAVQACNESTCLAPSTIKVKVE